LGQQEEGTRRFRYLLGLASRVIKRKSCHSKGARIVLSFVDQPSVQKLQPSSRPPPRSPPPRHQLESRPLAQHQSGPSGRDSPLLDSSVQRPGWWRSPRLPKHSNVPSHSCRSLAGPEPPPMLRRFLTKEAVSVKNVASGCPRSYCRRSHPTRIWNSQHSLPTTALIAVLVWQSRGCPVQNSSKHSLRHVFFFLLLS